MAAAELPDLPVRAVLDAVGKALDSKGTTVLVAPPGAGKTTLVPLALLDCPFMNEGKLILLEPRRLAARAAARRMASLLGEEVGKSVGYVMRMERCQSPATRILVVTEGVFTRMILDDPELAGVSAVLFDEFHERSLDADFGLALALDVRSALRPDLRLLVMSATLDGARIASLLGNAPVIESEGRTFPVEVRYQERHSGEPIEDTMTRTIRETLAREDGSILAFLPGQREIERTRARLEERIPTDVDVTPLYGALEGRDQDAAIRPAAAGRRKVVLATTIAETSITIDGVRVVIDSGLARVPRFEPSVGITRLETVRVSRASADQRAGRAGRTAPGIAIRLWRKEQTAALAAFSTPEILEADLSGLVLDSATFGVTNPTTLAFLDSPPKAALTEARALLGNLGAIDTAGHVTATGAAMRRLPLPARLAHMCIEAAKSGDAGDAARIAVLLTERGLGGKSPDLDRRLANFNRDKGKRAGAARNLARRWAQTAESAAERETASEAGSSVGALLLHAYPDRVAKSRGPGGRFVLANGRGAFIDETDALAGEQMLVIADLQGAAGSAHILAAASVDQTALEGALSGRFTEQTETWFDNDTRRVRARNVRRLGAIVLADAAVPPPKGAEADQAVLEAVRKHGLALLPWSKDALALRARLGWLAETLGKPWPSMDDSALLDRLEDWLLPFLDGSGDLDRIAPRLADGLRALIPHDRARQIGDLAPTHYDAPSGSRVPISYQDGTPTLAIRVQELFGLAAHPSIAGGKVPLVLELLSPAHRPIQMTSDLPGFWRGSWADVRAEMRGRYPKHEWPEDPESARATHRAKPRKR